MEFPESDEQETIQGPKGQWILRVGVRAKSPDTYPTANFFPAYLAPRSLKQTADLLDVDVAGARFGPDGWAASVYGSADVVLIR
jgi:hypothetical protein